MLVLSRLEWPVNLLRPFRQELALEQSSNPYLDLGIILSRISDVACWSQMWIYEYVLYMSHQVKRDLDYSKE